MNNIFITTEYIIPDSFYYLFYALDMGYQWFSIENSHFINEGLIFRSKSYINTDIKNWIFDMYKAKGGFYIDMTFLFPTILPQTTQIFDTVKFYFSQGKDWIIS